MTDPAANQAASKAPDRGRKFAEYWLDVDRLFFLQQIGVKEVPALA